MAGDVSKHLERAKRFLEKNRVEDAIEAYLAVLDEAPQHQEATQALGDLYARMDQAERAAVYYGLLFDLLVDRRTRQKPSRSINRFLRSNSGAQPPERIARYAFLQQKQNHPRRSDRAVHQSGGAFPPLAPARKMRFFAGSALRNWIPKQEPAIELAEAAERIGKMLSRRARFCAPDSLPPRRRRRRRAECAGPRAPARSTRAQRRTPLCPGKPAIRKRRPRRSLAGAIRGIRERRDVSRYLWRRPHAFGKSGRRAREVLEPPYPGEKEGMTRLFGLADHYAAAGQDQRLWKFL